MLISSLAGGEFPACKVQFPVGNFGETMPRPLILKNETLGTGMNVKIDEPRINYRRAAHDARDVKAIQIRG